MTANLTEMRSSKLIFLHRGFCFWEFVCSADHLSTRHPFSSQTMLSSVTSVEVAVVVVVVVVVVTLSQFPKLQIMSLWSKSVVAGQTITWARYLKICVLIKAANEPSAKFSQSLRRPLLVYFLWFNACLAYCLKSESASGHFQPGEGPSRGLLRDCTTSTMDRFTALVLQCGHTGHHRGTEPRLTEDRSLGGGARSGPPPLSGPRPCTLSIQDNILCHIHTQHLSAE